jgi:8-oxo-dGTP pyrophosphatase MutT (NUDIX family)
MRIYHRAAGYVVHRGCLLVNLHAHDDRPWEQAGLQVPAGGIAPGETPEAAVLREVVEETGLSEVRVVRYLGGDEYDLRPYRELVSHRHFFHLEVEGTPAAEWEHRERGGAGERRADGGVLLRHDWLPLARCGEGLLRQWRSRHTPGARGVGALASRRRAQELVRPGARAGRHSGPRA